MLLPYLLQFTLLFGIWKRTGDFWFQDAKGFDQWFNTKKDFTILQFVPTLFYVWCGYCQFLQILLISWETSMWLLRFLRFSFIFLRLLEGANGILFGLKMNMWRIFRIFKLWANWDCRCMFTRSITSNSRTISNSIFKINLKKKEEEEM